MLALAAQGTSPCGRVQAALAAKLADVNRRLQELQSFRDELARLTAQATSMTDSDGEARICNIVETARLASIPEPPRERVLVALRSRRATTTPRA